MHEGAGVRTFQHKQAVLVVREAGERPLATGRLADRGEHGLSLRPRAEEDGPVLANGVRADGVDNVGQPLCSRREQGVDGRVGEVVGDRGDGTLSAEAPVEPRIEVVDSLDGRFEPVSGGVGDHAVDIEPHARGIVGRAPGGDLEFRMHGPARCEGGVRVGPDAPGALRPEACLDLRDVSLRAPHVQ